MIWKLPQLFSPVTKRHVEQQVLYNTSINKLFHIIQNVNEYSQFLPLCTYSKIIPNTFRIIHDDTNNNSNNNNDHQQQYKHEEIQYFEATLTVGIPPLLQETYTSAVYINTQQYSIETKSIHVQNHKFDQLSSYWKLSNYDVTTNKENVHSNNSNSKNIQSDQLQHTSPTTTATTTHVYFMVEMTVSDPIISTTLDQLLKNVAQQQVAAFAQRCQQLK